MTSHEQRARAWYERFGTTYCTEQTTELDCRRHNAYLGRWLTYNRYGRRPDVLDSCYDKIDVTGTFARSAFFSEQTQPTRHVCEWNAGTSTCAAHPNPDTAASHFEIRYEDDDAGGQENTVFIYPECTHFQPERCPTNHGCRAVYNTPYSAKDLTCPAPPPPPLPPTYDSEVIGFHSNARAFYQGAFSRAGQQLSTRASFVVESHTNVGTLSSCMDYAYLHRTSTAEDAIIELSDHRLAIDVQLDGSAGAGTPVKVTHPDDSDGENPYAFTVHGCRHLCRLAGCDLFELKRNRATTPVPATDAPRECNCASFSPTGSTQLHDPVGVSDPATDPNVNRITGSPSTLPVNSFALADDRTCYLLHTEVGNVDYSNAATTNPADDPLSNSNVDLKLAWGCEACDPAHEMTLLQYGTDDQASCASADAAREAPTETVISVGKEWAQAVESGFSSSYVHNLFHNSGVGWVVPTRLNVPRYNAEETTSCTAASAAWEPLTLMQCIILAQHRRDLYDPGVPLHSSLQTINDDVEATTQDALGICKFKRQVGWYFDPLDHTNPSLETAGSIRVSSAIAAVADACDEQDVACACVTTVALTSAIAPRALLQEFFVTFPTRRQRMARARQLEAETAEAAAFDAEAFRNGFAAAASLPPAIVTVTIAVESATELRITVLVRPLASDFLAVRSRMRALARADQRAKLVDLTGAVITRALQPTVRHARSLVPPPSSPPGLPPLAPPLPLEYFAIGRGETCESASTPGSALREPTLHECREIAEQANAVFELYDHPTGALHEESGCLEWKTHDLQAVEFIVNDATHPCPQSEDVVCYCVHV